MEPHDLVVFKLVAMGEKDIGFSLALIEADLVDVELLLVRTDQLGDDYSIQRRRTRRWLEENGKRLGKI